MQQLSFLQMKQRGEGQKEKGEGREKERTVAEMTQWIKGLCKSLELI